MSNSDSDDIDVNALKEIFGDEIGDFETKTKKPQTNKEKSKLIHKPKRNPKISLDALLDGVDINPLVQNESKQTKTVQNNNFGGFDDLDIPKVGYTQNKKNPFEEIERNISNYLEKSILSLTKEFGMEIEKILNQQDYIDEIVFDFIDSVRSDIRDSLKLEEAAQDKRLYISNYFNSFSDDFLDAFKDAGKFSDAFNQSFKCAKKIHACRTLVKTRQPVIERQMFNAINQLGSEIRELKTLRYHTKPANAYLEKKGRELFKKKVSLEAKLKGINCLREDISKFIERQQELRDKEVNLNEKIYIEPELLLKRIKIMSKYFKARNSSSKNYGMNPTRYEIVQSKLKELSDANKKMSMNLIHTSFLIDRMANYQNAFNLPIYEPGQPSPYFSPYNNNSTSMNQNNTSLKAIQYNHETRLQQMNAFFSNMRKNKTMINE